MQRHAATGNTSECEFTEPPPKRRNRGAADGRRSAPTVMPLSACPPGCTIMAVRGAHHHGTVCAADPMSGVTLWHSSGQDLGGTRPCVLRRSAHAARNLPNRGHARTEPQSKSGLGDLTARFLRELVTNVEHFTPAEAARLSTAALEVLATRLARESYDGDWGTPQERRHAQLTTIQSFILQHLGEVELNPGRHRRPANFSRAFRAAHGMTPSEFRDLARAAQRSAL